MLAGYPHLLATARRLQWDERAIALTDDATAARRLGDADRDELVELVGGFCLAERAVAAELAPYVAATAPDSVERGCFAMQQRDEQRHARFFERVAREVLARDPGALAGGVRGPLRALFADELPEAAAELARRADPASAAEAVGLYHLVLEGIVFAVGQEALIKLAERTGLRGVADGVARVQGDERWHVGLGVLHLQRLGAPVDVDAAAGRALAAWGPRIATPERVRRVLSTHERRLMIGRERSPTA